jgi:hypothetical protein
MVDEDVVAVMHDAFLKKEQIEIDYQNAAPLR